MITGRPNPRTRDKDSDVPSQYRPTMSLVRCILNCVGCALVLYLYVGLARSSTNFLTIDILIIIFLAELNRFSSENERRHAVKHKGSVADSIEHVMEEGLSGTSKKDRSLERGTDRPECMAAVIGYREDTQIFTQALESYRHATGCRFLLVGIDGDDREDEYMIEIFRKVGLQSYMESLISTPSFISI